MDPVAFTVLGRPIYWYGVMVAAAFLAAVANWSRLARREGRPDGYGSELGFWMMLSGLLGARVAYVLANLGDFLPNPVEMLRIDKGGLIFYGGFIGAALALIVLARLQREPLLRLSDFTVTGLPLGHAIGRVGCFLNGCCYGSESHLPWCINLDGVCRHPTQLYESAFNLLLYGLLLFVFARRRKDGQILALYLLVYPAGRFLLELLRGDPRLHWHGFDVAQELSLALFAAGLLLAAYVARRGRPAEQPAAPAKPGGKA